MSVSTAKIDLKQFRISVLFVKSVGKRRDMTVFQFSLFNKFLLIQSRTIPGKSLMDFEKGKSLSFLVGPEMCSGLTRTCMVKF